METEVQSFFQQVEALLNHPQIDGELLGDWYTTTLRTLLLSGVIPNLSLQLTAEVLSLLGLFNSDPLLKPSSLTDPESFEEQEEKLFRVFDILVNLFKKAEKQLNQLQVDFFLSFCFYFSYSVVFSFSCYLLSFVFSSCSFVLFSDVFFF